MPLLYSSKRSSWDVAEDAEDTEKPEAAPEPVLAKRDKRVLGVIAITALVTFFGGLALAGYAAINYKYETAQDGPSEQVAFTVPRGSGLSSIAQNLEDDGFIESAFLSKR